LGAAQRSRNNAQTYGEGGEGNPKFYL